MYSDQIYRYIVKNHYLKKLLNIFKYKIKISCSIQNFFFSSALFPKFGVDHQHPSPQLPQNSVSCIFLTHTHIILLYIIYLLFLKTCPSVFNLFSLIFSTIHSYTIPCILIVILSFLVTIYSFIFTFSFLPHSYFVLSSYPLPNTPIHTSLQA